MVNRGNIAAVTDYASWLAEARQALSEQQHVVYTVFTADNTAVSFDKISNTTCKVLPELRPGQG